MRPNWQEIITKTIAMIRGAPEMQAILHGHSKKFKRYFRKNDARDGDPMMMESFMSASYPPENPYRRFLMSVCYRWFEAATRGFKSEAAVYHAAAEMLDARARIWDLTEEISNRFAWEESR